MEVVSGNLEGDAGSAPVHQREDGDSGRLVGQQRLQQEELMAAANIAVSRVRGGDVEGSCGVTQTAG
jgi:hypothetical protein